MLLNSGRTAVLGDSIYIGNQSNSLSELALKSDIPNLDNYITDEELKGMIDMGSVIVDSFGVHATSNSTVSYNLTACDYAIIYGSAYTAVTSDSDSIYFNYKTMLAKGGTCVALASNIGSKAVKIGNVTLTLNSDGTSLTMNPASAGVGYTYFIHFTVIAYKYKS